MREGLTGVHEGAGVETRFNPRVVVSLPQAGLHYELASLTTDATQVTTWLDQTRSYVLRLDGVPWAEAQTLAEAYRAHHGHAIFPSPAPAHPDATTDLLLSATWDQHQQVLHHLDTLPTGLIHRLQQEISSTLQAYRQWPGPPMPIGSAIFDWQARTYIMGIINVTPDSFSGDGLGTNIDAVLQQARSFVAAGADILDVGGESTRPGAQPISAEEEMRRVLPAIKAIADHLDVPISVDTYKAEVAAAALDAGAHMVNDVWGLRMDPAMAPLVAERGVPVIVMHNRSRPKDAVQEHRLGGRYIGVQYQHLLGDILRELRASIATALQAGITLSQIIVDPGIGFGKTVAQNLTLIRQLNQLRSLGRPILVGTSRKSFIGYTLDAPPTERVPGTAATVVLAIERGANIVRVHDVAVMSKVVKMTDAILRR